MSNSLRFDADRPFIFRLPRFIGVDHIGLGDLIARITKAFGAKPCGGCAQRAMALNRAVAFRAGVGLSMSDSSAPSGKPVPADIAPVGSGSTSGTAPKKPICQVIVNTFFDNTCTAGPCPAGTKCAWTKAKLKFLPGVFLWSSDTFRPEYPRDFEPTECGCLSVIPSLTLPPVKKPTGATGGEPEELPHSPEGPTISEEELQRLREGYEIELWTGPGD